MELNKIVEKFKTNPKYMTNGAGRLSRMWNCSKKDIYKAREIVRGEKPVIKTGAKILIFDIESSPMVSYHWGHWQQNIYLDQVIENPIILTWSAKWLYNSVTMSDKISVKEVLERDDSRIVNSLWSLMDEADIVIAHYGDRFDIPLMNSRFILNDLPPVSSIKSIDTKAVASRNFKFPSNKLDALGGYFGLGQKIHTDFLLWRGCMEGNADKIEEMRVYNVQDVVLLEEVYLKLRPYIKMHPNMAIYNETEAQQCAMCGSTDLKHEGYYYTNTSKYDQFRCSCGALSRGRKNILDKDKKNKLLTSIPR